MDGFTPVEEEIRARADETPRTPAEHERYITLLGYLGGLLQDHPELPEPYINPPASLHFCCSSREGMAAAMRALRGRWTKRPVETETGGYFECRGEWRGYQVHVTASRERVCRRVVTGTREITETVPDPVKLAEVPQIEVTRTEDVVEWVCGPVTAPATAESSAAA